MRLVYYEITHGSKVLARFRYLQRACDYMIKRSQGFPKPIHEMSMKCHTTSLPRDMVDKVYPAEFWNELPY